MSDPATLTITYRDRSQTIALRADVAEYLSTAPLLRMTDWSVADVIQGVWAAFRHLAKPNTREP